uniref:Uncharacterized protein n=1 Tax=Poecilia reticulata TaxID=8081 RepID=A0A3P9NKQ8_POERE
MECSVFGYRVITGYDIKIVLEGIRVVSNLDSVPTAAVILEGLIYGLNLAYPVLQKITMELDGGELSNKTLFLKNLRYVCIRRGSVFFTNYLSDVLLFAM